MHPRPPSRRPALPHRAQPPHASGRALGAHLAPWARLARRLAVALALAAGLAPAQAGELLHVPTRPQVQTTLFWDPVTATDLQPARGTVLLFPGGGGGFGPVVDGQAQGRNFLVRSAALWRAQGYHVALFGRPSDARELDYADRIAEPHLQDVHAVLAHLRTLSPLPIWLVGTSRGTVSATAAALREQAGLAGLVLSSSVVSPKKPGAVPTQALGALRLPVLLLHHARDACAICNPQEVPRVLQGLTQAPRKALLMLDGGGPPSGDACAALHWHGFIGMEAEAVERVTDWMAAPSR